MKRAATTETGLRRRAVMLPKGWRHGEGRVEGFESLDRSNFP